MSRRTPTSVLAGLAALAVVSLSACGAVDGSAHSVAPAASTATTTTAPATPSATPSATAAPAPAPAVAAPVAPKQVVPAPARNTGGTAGGTGGGSNTGGSGTGGGTSGGGSAPSAPGPTITSFTVSKPNCSAGNVTVSWKVSGAGGAAIAVDNPDTYGAFGSDYPASGSQELPFSCGSGTTTHTYTVWPAGAKNVSKTISVSAHSDS